MPQTSAPVSVRGLAQLRRDLRDVDPVILRGLRAELKAAGEIVRVAAQAGAPVRTGHLRDSIKTGTAGDRVQIKSALPYANVVHWGGNVPSNRSASTRPKRYFAPNPFIQRAAEANATAVGERILAGIDRVLSEHFKTI